MYEVVVHLDQERDVEVLNNAWPPAHANTMSALANDKELCIISPTQRAQAFTN